MRSDFIVQLNVTVNNTKNTTMLLWRICVPGSNKTHLVLRVNCPVESAETKLAQACLSFTWNMKIFWILKYGPQRGREQSWVCTWECAKLQTWTSGYIWKLASRTGPLQNGIPAALQGLRTETPILSRKKLKRWINRGKKEVEYSSRVQNDQFRCRSRREWVPALRLMQHNLGKDANWSAEFLGRS